MIRVKIEPAYDADWLYPDEWKWNVCSDFDENVVITGNNRYYEIEDASWWCDALSLINELDNYYDGDIEEFVDISDSGFSKAKICACARLYEDQIYSGGGYSDDLEFIIEIAEILYPKLDLEYCTLRGSSQGEWTDAVYVAGKVDSGILEDYFFENLVNINVYTVEVDEDGDEDEELEGSDTISYTEYRNIDDIEQYVRDMGVVNIPPDEEIEIEDY